MMHLDITLMTLTVWDVSLGGRGKVGIGWLAFNQHDYFVWFDRS